MVKKQFATELTPLQERFKNNILKGMNGKAAYIAAGYKARGAAAEAAASRLLRKGKMRSVIEKAQKRASDRAEATHERILREEMRLAYFDPAGLVDDNGKPLRLHELPEDVRRAIAGLEVVEQADGTLKFKYRFNDKGRSLERLEKICGMFAPEKHEINGKDGSAIDLTAMVMKITVKNADRS
jgi:phage terminase small subunit